MKPPPAVFTAISAGPAPCAAATVASPATHTAINSTHPKTQNGFRMERFTVLLLCELNYASPETGQAKPRARPATLPRPSDKVVKDLSRVQLTAPSLIVAGRERSVSTSTRGRIDFYCMRAIDPQQPNCGRKP